MIGPEKMETMPVAPLSAMVSMKELSDTCIALLKNVAKGRGNLQGLKQHRQTDRQSLSITVKSKEAKTKPKTKNKTALHICVVR